MLWRWLASFVRSGLLSLLFGRSIMSAALDAEMLSVFVPGTVVGANRKKKHSHTSRTSADKATAPSATPTRQPDWQSPPVKPHRPFNTPQPRPASPHLRFHSSPASAPSFAQPTVFSLLATAPAADSTPASLPSLPLSASSSSSSGSGSAVSVTNAAVRSSIESELSLSRVDRRKAKKKRKLIMKGKGNPTVHDIHSVYGPAPRASIQLKLHEYFHEPSNRCLRAREVHQLIGWVLGEEVSPKW